MGINLTLENFQIYKNLELEFNPGLTIITGPSNSGKSSILRALETLILNPSSNLEDISYDENEMRITLNIDGNTYSYSRSTSGVTYTINGIEHSKIGRDNLVKLSNDFNLVLDEEDNILNIQGEWNVMFPFDRKDAGLFKLFEDIFSIINSNEMIKVFNSESSIIKSKIESNLKDMTKINNQISLIEEFTSISYDYSNIEILDSKVEELNKIKFIDLESINPIHSISYDYFKVNEDLNKFKDSISPIELKSFDLLNIYKEYMSICYSLNSYDINEFISIETISYELELILKYERLSESILQINLNVDALNNELSKYKEEHSQIKICPLCNNKL